MSVIYRGVSMADDWPEKIQLAQQQPFVSIGGERVERVRYGSEAEDWGADRGPCHDCGVIKGEFHVPECDVERCPVCAGQFGGCDCEYDDEDEE
jgi:hypothetical protein